MKDAKKYYFEQFDKNYYENIQSYFERYEGSSYDETEIDELCMRTDSYEDFFDYTNNETIWDVVNCTYDDDYKLSEKEVFKLFMEWAKENGGYLNDCLEQMTEQYKPLTKEQEDRERVDRLDIERQFI